MENTQKNAEKSTLRRQIKLSVSQMSEKEKALLSQRLCALLCESKPCQKAKNILLFSPLKDEVDITALFTLWQDKNLYLPVVEGNDLRIEPYRADALQKGSFSIMEPTTHLDIPLSQMDVVIVPGVAFDSDLHRMGRGKGYYDRLLSGSQVYKIGICYPQQLINQVPFEKHDVLMNEIITAK